jgi:DNA polymerase-3 subunit epsilon
VNKIKMEYAIVDIETTGGYALRSGITEVAIFIHNGEEVIDQYETLINPFVPIPLYIQALTGISDEMVLESPPFKEVAEKVFRMLEGRVFVAHNVNFDYSFIKHHLEIAGYPFNAQKLCTVRLSRKLKPGLKSYSLGRLCDALGTAGQVKELVTRYTGNDYMMQLVYSYAEQFPQKVLRF